MEEVGGQSCCPTCTEPRPDEAPGQEIDDNQPVCADSGKGHRHCSKRQGRSDDNQAMALLRMTACNAAKRKTPMRRGSRNSAPPRPMSPPNAPITAPPPNAAR